jgi:integral membrane protein (TIGR01906 family)
VKPISVIVSVIVSISLFLILLCAAIEIPTFNLDFYSTEYDKHNIPASIHVEKNDLMRVTDHLLKYMRGLESDLVVEVSVAGETREFFNQREKDHMVDVKELFRQGFNIRNATLVLLLIGLISVALMKKTRILMNIMRWVMMALFILCALPVVFIVMDFDSAFTIFHELFFTNDLWILDSRTDLLVNIVPQPFFIDISSFIGMLFAGMNIAIISAVHAAYHFLRKCDFQCKNGERGI